MLPFSEANVNIYLDSISSNQTQLVNFANDMQANFLNCFQTRFIMTPQDIASLNSWPAIINLQLTLLTKQAVDLYLLNTSADLTLEVEGFEAPTDENSENDLDVKLRFADEYKIKGYLTVDHSVSTGNTIIKAKAEVQATWYIC